MLVCIPFFRTFNHQSITMKRLFLILLFIATSIGVFAQKMDCSKFRDGKFKTEEKYGLPQTTIIRKGEFQKEKVKGERGYYEFIVKWVDDCTYTLTPTPKTLAKTPTSPKDAVLTVTIIEVKENSYVQTTSSNYSTLKLTLEIFKVK